MELQQVATTHESVLSDPAPNTRIFELGENAITAQVEFWIEALNNIGTLAVRSDFRQLVKRQFDEEDTALAPPPRSCSREKLP
ncbi:MAG: hypothetical protein ACLFNI_08745 [Natronomonas sp.]